MRTAIMTATVIAVVIPVAVIWQEQPDPWGPKVPWVLKDLRGIKVPLVPEDVLVQKDLPVLLVLKDLKVIRVLKGIWGVPVFRD